MTFDEDAFGIETVRSAALSGRGGDGPDPELKPWAVFSDPPRRVNKRRDQRPVRCSGLERFFTSHFSLLTSLLHPPCSLQGNQKLTNRGRT
jgi:hypothetical protein